MKFHDRYTSNRPCVEFRCQFPAGAKTVQKIPLRSARTNCTQAADILEGFDVGRVFFEAEKRFSLMAGKSDVLRRAGAGHAVGRVEPDPAEAAEELGQGQAVCERQ